jgi:hypothetical protein
MGETPPRYRTLRYPGPGLAPIAEPDGRVALWSRKRWALSPRTCAQCRALSLRHYRPSPNRGKDGPRPCRPCAEATAGA